MASGYPPGYDPSMDPTLSGDGMGPYQVGLDPMAGPSIAPAPQLSAYDRGTAVAQAAGQGVEFGTNAYFAGAMIGAPMMAASSRPMMAAAGRMWGATDPFKHAFSMGGSAAKGAWGATSFMGSAGRGLASWGAGGGAARGMASMAMRGGMAGTRMAIAGTAAASVAGLPLAAGMGLMEAGIQAGTSMYEGAANASAGQSMIAGAAPRTMQYSAQDARSFGANTMPGMAKEMGLSTEGLQGLTQQLSGQGTFTGARDIREFTTKLRTALNELKEIGRVTGMALDESAQMAQMLKSQGFRGTGVTRGAGRISAQSQATGVPEGILAQSGMMGADVGRQMGLNREMMFNMYSRGTASMRHGYEQGTVSRDLVDFFGGAEESAMMTNTAVMQRMMGSRMHGLVMGFGKLDDDPAKAEVDPYWFQRVISGNFTEKDLARVTPEMVNAAMSEQVRHQFAPYAQASMVNYAMQQGGGDVNVGAAKLGQLAGMSKQQSLLVIQQGLNNRQTGTATAHAANRQAFQANMQSAQQSDPGWWTQQWRGTVGPSMHRAGQAAQGMGQGIADWASGADDKWFFQNELDTPIRITQGSIQEGRNVSFDIEDSQDALRRLEGRMVKGGGARRRDRDFYSNDLFGGRPGSNLWQDWFEGDEEYYGNIGKTYFGEGSLGDKYGEGSMRFLGGDAVEGKDFIRGERGITGEDVNMSMDMYGRLSGGRRRGASAFAGASREGRATAGARLKDIASIIGDSKGKIGNFDASSQAGAIRRGRRGGGGLEDRDETGLSETERATIALTQEVLYGANAQPYIPGMPMAGQGQTLEAMYLGMEDMDRVETMAMWQQGLAEAAADSQGVSIAGMMSFTGAREGGAIGHLGDIRGINNVMKSQAAHIASQFGITSDNKGGFATAIATDATQRQDLVKIGELLARYEEHGDNADKIRAESLAAKHAAGSGAGSEGWRELASKMAHGEVTAAQFEAGDVGGFGDVGKLQSYMQMSGQQVEALATGVRGWLSAKGRTDDESLSERAGRVVTGGSQEEARAAVAALGASENPVLQGLYGEGSDWAVSERERGSGVWHVRDRSQRWEESEKGVRREGELGAEFGFELSQVGALSGSSTARERLDASRDLMRSIYDYEGDQQAEAQAASMATAGRSQYATNLLSAVLSPEKGNLDSEKAEAAWRSVGIDPNDAMRQMRLAKEGGTDAEGNIVEGGRAAEVEKALELMGTHIDQTLATPVEAMGTMAENMSIAADTLLTAGNLMIDAAYVWNPLAALDTGG